MSEPTKTFLTNLALASGCGMAFGALVACAAYPLLQWWADRSSGEVEQRDDASLMPFQAAPSPDEFDLEAAVERLVGGYKP